MEAIRQSKLLARRGADGGRALTNASRQFEHLNRRTGEEPLIIRDDAGISTLEGPDQTLGPGQVANRQ